MNYCPKCGKMLHEKNVDNANVKVCLNCDFIDWNNWVNVACVTIAVNKNKEVLLVELSGKEEGKYTFPGGYRNLGESLEEGAIREFYEETGMKVHDLELYKVFSKDENRLIWVVFKGIVDESAFIENSETKKAFFIKSVDEVDLDKMRGNLSKKVLVEYFMNEE